MPPRPSLTMISMLWSTNCSVLGVQLIKPLAVIVMPYGGLFKLNCKLSPSESVAITLYWYEASNMAWTTGCELITGALFCCTTTTLNVWLAIPLLLSETLTIILCSPTCDDVGNQATSPDETLMVMPVGEVPRENCKLSPSISSAVI